jgi:protein-tyrosine phosphatase
MPSKKKIKVMFVCLGNICRSPLAEGVFRHLVREAGLEDRFEIASSGTGAWHVGQMPDRRMRQTAAGHGLSLDGQVASQFKQSDLETYDHIYAMDRENQRAVLSRAPRGTGPAKVALFRDYDPSPGDRQVPDPYYGGAQGFEEVYRIVERTARALLDHLVEEHQLTPLSQ